MSAPSLLSYWLKTATSSNYWIVAVPALKSKVTA